MDDHARESPAAIIIASELSFLEVARRLLMVTIYATTPPRSLVPAIVECRLCDLDTLTSIDIIV